MLVPMADGGQMRDNVYRIKFFVDSDALNLVSTLSPVVREMFFLTLDHRTTPKCADFSAQR